MLVTTVDELTLAIANVPEAFAVSCQSRTAPLLCVGLHQHENKMSLVNLKLKRAQDGYSEAIKSKEELEFQVGFMRSVLNTINGQTLN